MRGRGLLRTCLSLDLRLQGQIRQQSFSKFVLLNNRQKTRHSPLTKTGFFCKQELFSNTIFPVTPEISRGSIVKHVFLLNIHTGHTMLHTVCEQAGSTVCLWMAPHFQTSANGKCFSRTQTTNVYVLLYIFILSWCHNVRRQSSITLLCCRLFANKWGGLVCGWGHTIRHQHIYGKYFSIVQQCDASASEFKVFHCALTMTQLSDITLCTIVRFHFVTVS